MLYQKARPDKIMIDEISSLDRAGSHCQERKIINYDKELDWATQWDPWAESFLMSSCQGY